jgi:hypothetical protein
LCYSLDNYGLRLLRVDKAELAREQFEDAHTLRKKLGSDLDLAQSAVNMGHWALRRPVGTRRRVTSDVRWALI